MSRKHRARILWVMDQGDLEKVAPWVAARQDRVTDVVNLYHDDTGAVSICFFDGDLEEGIIRCANGDLAEKVSSLLPTSMSPVTNLGGGY